MTLFTKKVSFTDAYLAIIIYVGNIYVRHASRLLWFPGCRQWPCHSPALRFGPCSFRCVDKCSIYVGKHVRRKRFAFNLLVTVLDYTILIGDLDSINSTLTLRPSMVVSSCSTSKIKSLVRSGKPSADPVTLYWSPSWENSAIGFKLRTFWRFSGGTPLFDPHENQQQL